MLSSVDLPDPDGPVIAIDSPSSICKVTSRRATTSRVPRT
jgi:hypothetical protein